MGFVYFGIGDEPGRAVISAAENLEERLANHKGADVTFRFYRVLDTAEFLACERYLHELYACRRLMIPHGEPWFAMELEELDHAVRLWERKSQRHAEGTMQLKKLKAVQSSPRQ